MDRINNINETGGAGDWGTDKARARLQKDTPGQEITKGKKMKTFKDILNNIDESSTNIEEALQQVHTIKITANAPSNPKPSEVADIKNDFKLHVQATRAAIKSAGGLITDTEVPSRQNKFVGTIKIGTRGDASKLDVKSIQKAVKSGGIELHDKQFEDIQEAMSEKDKKKRLAMIRQAVEKINKQNADKAKKDALAMMKASGMFDEDVELQEIRKAPQIKHLNIYGSEISGLRSGNKYYMAMAIDMRGKLMYKVIDEFGSIETIDLKTFAKRFG